MLLQYFRYTVEVVWVYYEYAIIQIFNILTFQYYEHFNIFTTTIMQMGIKAEEKTNMDNDMGLNIFTVNIWVIYLGDIQTDCATHNEYISKVHDTICIKMGTYL